MIDQNITNYFNFSEKMIQAYNWWDNEANPFELNVFLLIPSPQHANLVFQQLHPILSFIRDDSPPSYWNKISTFISKFMETVDILDPLDDFPAYVSVLYNLRYLIFPKKLIDCHAFDIVYQSHAFSKFLVYEAPFFIFSPLLYFESLIGLYDIGSTL
jgi:hypothetical protein